MFQTCLGPLLFVLLISRASASSKVIYIGHITSYGQSGLNSSGAIPAVELALEHINNNTSVLDGYKLVSTPVMDSQCDHIKSLDAFFSSVVYATNSYNVIALVGCGCGVATEPVADISHRWNITQISYESGSAALSNRGQFKQFFRTWPSLKDIVPGLVSLLKHYNWTRVLFLTQKESLFTAMSSAVVNLINTEQAGISVFDNSFPSSQKKFNGDNFKASEDCRIFFMNMYEQWGNLVLCEAARRNLTYPRYMWITYGWMADEWWKKNEFEDNGCSLDDKLSVLDHALVIQHNPVINDPAQGTVGGYTLSQYLELYNQRKTFGNYSNTPAHTLAYDAIWALAIALNKTDQQMKTNASISECEKNDYQGHMNITLDQFQYSNSKLACYLKENLLETNFSGTSGRVYFDKNGTRILHRINIFQFRKDGSSLVKKCTGYIDLDQNSTYPFYDDCNETLLSVFPNGVPPDGTPLNATVTNNLAMSITYFILASIGIILVLLCAAFNVVFRNRKIVQLTSPKLNYFILIGTILLYTGIYSNIVLTKDENLGTIQCHFQIWLVFLGYSLVLGTVIAKLWRVYHIFHNPTPAKKPIYDWQLACIIFVLSGIQTSLLFFWSVVPQLKPHTHLVLSAESPTVEKESVYGLVKYYYVPTCYKEDTPSFYWLILLMIYTAFLQCLAMILAFQTRKVKLSVLNDSKHVAACIYISSLTLVTLTFTHLGFLDYLNIGHGVLNGVIFVNSTSCLGLLFLPKMISLYKDPEGSSVFEKSLSNAKYSTEKTGGVVETTKEKGDVLKTVEKKELSGATDESLNA